MGDIRELAERHWLGEGDLVHDEHPVRPVLERAAEEVVDRVLVLKSIASVNAIDTGDGLVLLDTGGPFDSDHVFESVRHWRPQTPLREAVFSHHHIDHVFGTARFEQEAGERSWPRPVVYGHEAMGEHFSRYERTRGWNTAINQRQFGLPLEGFSWPEHWRRPDVTYADRLTFRRGDFTFELHHDRGETDDATWTWIPELRVLHPGDLFIWAVPNAGNPQKAQRYVGEWAAALRKMAAKGAEVLLSGHGLPIFGADRIHAALTDTAELLESLDSQTLALMNAGASLDTVLHGVTTPEHLRDRPYLRPVYDHPQFIVRNIWRRFGGWHDGEPDHLLPAPRAQQAAEWVALGGGVAVVLDRARELAAEGDHRMACHLVEHAVCAAPDDPDVHALRAEVYAARASTHEGSMARNLLQHAAEASKRGRRDLAGDW